MAFPNTSFDLCSRKQHLEYDSPDPQGHSSAAAPPNPELGRVPLPLVLDADALAWSSVWNAGLSGWPVNACDGCKHSSSSNNINDVAIGRTLTTRDVLAIMIDFIQGFVRTNAHSDSEGEKREKRVVETPAVLVSASASATMMVMMVMVCDTHAMSLLLVVLFLRLAFVWRRRPTSNIKSVFA